MKKELLAGLSAFALMLAVSGTAMADGVDIDNNVDFGAAAGVDDNADVRGNTGNTGAGADAVASNALMQVSANALAGDDITSSITSQLAGDLTFSNDVFREQRVNNNNFNTATNSNVQQAIAVAGTNQNF